jgi:P-type Cu2+ transporter
LSGNIYIGLDSPNEWAKFSKLTDESNQFWQSNVVVDGMHCAACALNIEKTLNAVDGVKMASVNAATKRALITWSSVETKPSFWFDAIETAGYKVLPSNELAFRNARKKEQRIMLWRLLVAGFCMMQIMMYAYPTYIANTGEMTPDVRNLLRWASWVLSLPIVLFSASPFLKNAWNDFKRKQISMDMPVAIGILVSFIVSSLVTFQTDLKLGQEVYFDSMSMFVFFLLLGRWIELKMRDKTAGALDVLMRRLPATIERKSHSGDFVRIPVSDLKIGDEVRVLPGEVFPADGILIDGCTSVDEALLTGESSPVDKNASSNLIAGSYNLSAVVLMRVLALGSSTKYAEIITLMQSASIQKPRLAKIADKIAQPFLLFVILIAFLTGAFLWEASHEHALMVAVSILIVTCPCALSLATPVALIAASGALAKKGLLVKNIQAIEAISQIDTVVFDKTGTLSRDGLVVISAESYDDFSKNSIVNIAKQISLQSLHPVAVAMQKLTVDKEEYYYFINITEIPGAGLIANHSLGEFKLGSALFCGISDEVEQTSVYLTLNGRKKGVLRLEEKVNDLTIHAISELKELGLKVEILSGDKQQAVKKFANVLKVENAFGQNSPQDKLEHMKKLIASGKKVAMVGDGLNDGPTLALAYVSIAMGRGVPIIQSGADFILMNDNINFIGVLIKHAKKAMQTVKQNLVWALLYNAVCIPLAVMGFLPAWLAGLGMAISSLVVVLNAVKLSNLPELVRRA